MTDIVERLRRDATCSSHYEAADEIERLRDAHAELEAWSTAEIERLREYLRNIQMVQRSDAAYGVIQCLARAALPGDER